MDDSLVPDNVSSASGEGWVWKVKATREGVMARKVEQRWAMVRGAELLAAGAAERVLSLARVQRFAPRRAPRPCRAFLVILIPVTVNPGDPPALVIPRPCDPIRS